MPHETDKILSLIEKSLIELENYPTKEGLWRQLRSRMSRSDFEAAISKMVAEKKIIFVGSAIIYIDVNNPLLESLINNSVPV
jgi:hypothetical protein